MPYKAGVISEKDILLLKRRLNNKIENLKNE